MCIRDSLGVQNEHPTGEVIGRWWVRKLGANGGVQRGYLIVRARHRVNHAVADFAGHAGVSVLVKQGVAIGRIAALGVPASRRMAAQAKFAGVGGVVVGHGEGGPEQRVAPGLTHHAAPPGFINRVCVATVT